MAESKQSLTLAPSQEWLDAQHDPSNPLYGKSWAEASGGKDMGFRLYVCPECGRAATVAPWVSRPICVHSWDATTPEIWDADDTDGEGTHIEQSPNEEYRVEGKWWSLMREASNQDSKEE